MLFKTHRIAPQFSPDSGPRAIPGHHHDPGRRRFLGLNNLNDLDRPIHHKHSPLNHWINILHSKYSNPDAAQQQSPGI